MVNLSNTTYGRRRYSKFHSKVGVIFSEVGILLRKTVPDLVLITAAVFIRIRFLVSHVVSGSRKKERTKQPKLPTLVR